MKKLLFLIFTLMPVIAHASDFEVGGFGYKILDNDKVEIDHCNSTKKDITIPIGVRFDDKAYSVISIGNEAFKGDTYITSVTIGRNISSIGEYAFSGCCFLTSVAMSKSVSSIGKGAFKGCDRLTSITIPNSVTSIGDYAFNGCDRLTSITIPNSVTSIGDYAFSFCM